MTKFFVYVANSHGLPEPQIWHSAMTDGNGKAKETLAIHEMSEADDKMTIRELIARYQYEAKE